MKKLPELIKKLLPERKGKPEKPVYPESSQTITLHFVDELTGRAATFDFPQSTLCWRIMFTLQENGFLPPDALGFRIQELKGIPLHREISSCPLRNGDTLHVVLEDADELRKSGSLSRLFEEYTVTIQWQEARERTFSREPEGSCCFARILCHGYDTKSGIEQKLGKKFAQGGTAAFKIDEEIWPQYRTHPNGEREKLVYLCQLNSQLEYVIPVQYMALEAELPQQDISLYAKYIPSEERLPPPPLYGCPTAKGLRDAVGALHCNVEIVSYE